MQKTWILLCCCAIAIAACERAPSSPEPIPAPASPAAAEAAPEPHAPAARPARRPAGALKSELPEGFQLPFAFHRLYDNTGKSATGKAQRRVLVEFLDEDGAAVESALSAALQAKGFAAPTSEVEGGMTRLQFQRPDGASVQVKIDPKREKPRAPNAKGTVHLIWNGA